MRLKRIFLVLGIVGIFCGLSWLNSLKTNSKSYPTTTWNTLTVEVRGAVNLPGEYTIPEDWTIAKLLSLCGLKGDADTADIDWDQLLEADKLYQIPYLEKKEANEYLYVNINVASVEELDELPEIGIHTAEAIVAYRLEHPFKSIEEIKNVSGIGEETYNAIKAHIFV